MCGIAGLFDLVGTRSFDAGLVARMRDTLRHRGPDGEGLLLEPGVALAHRRLAVIDLAGGHQPLFNEDGTVAVVFNGEIYNYRELVPQLERLGHWFETRSDTEVIVHAWEEWGESCVHRFRGMFAFALWDRARECLFLARDRLGVKPLHYVELADGSFAFASEIKALRAHPGFDPTIDPQALEEYFALGYVADPRSIYLRVKKLAPGHCLLVRRGRPRVPRQYWDLRFSLDNPIGLADAAEELRERLRESVRLRMIADVPHGAFLSGGVDSSAVVATMAGLSDEPVNTCAIAFDDPAYDESAHASRVAERYHTRHFCGRVDSEDFDLIEQLVDLYDEPYADSSAMPTWRVCRLARGRVTVALSGDGGDESFGGYRRYRLHLMEERMRAVLPQGVRQPVFGLLGRWYPKADWAPRVLRARSTFQALARDSVEGYFHGVSLLRDDDRRRLFSPALRARLGGYSALEVFRRHAARAGTDDPLALIQYLDLKTYLPCDINTKVDRASMAHSLEVREPLMDPPLVEWLASLPSGFKVHGQVGKFLLKRAMEPLLPQDLLYRPKMGFAVPLAQWFRGPLAARVEAALTGPVLAESGFFNGAALQGLLAEHRSGRRDYSASLWSLLMFEAFLRREQGAATGPSSLSERLADRSAA